MTANRLFFAIAWLVAIGFCFAVWSLIIQWAVAIILWVFYA
jgi:hypothetical protein